MVMLPPPPAAQRKRGALELVTKATQPLTTTGLLLEMLMARRPCWPKILTKAIHPIPRRRPQTF